MFLDTFSLVMKYMCISLFNEYKLAGDLCKTAQCILTGEHICRQV
jgi:hypothetical protein